MGVKSFAMTKSGESSGSRKGVGNAVLSSVAKHLRPNAEKITCRDLNEVVTAVAFSTKGASMFAAATVHGLLQVYDSKTGNCVAKHQGKSCISSLRFFQPTAQRDSGAGALAFAHSELVLTADYHGKLTCLQLRPSAARSAASKMLRRQQQQVEAEDTPQPYELLELEKWHWGGSEINAMDCSAWNAASRSLTVVVAGPGAHPCVCELTCEAIPDDSCAGGAVLGAAGGGPVVGSPPGSSPGSPGGSSPIWKLAVEFRLKMRLRQHMTTFAVAIDDAGEVVATGGESKLFQIWHVGFAARLSTEDGALPELVHSCKSAVHVRGAARLEPSEPF